MNKIISCIIIIVLGFLIYANSFQNEFVWDDEFLIERNVCLRSFDFLPDIFKNELFYFYSRNTGISNNYYRPLQTLSFMFDYRIGKLNPLGYHITNTLIHIINAILIYFLCCMLQASGFRLKSLKSNSNQKLATCSLQPVAFIASLLWLVHPIHTQAVTYISGRADPMAAMFMLLALLLQVTGYKSQVTSKRILEFMTCVAYICALLSKEMALIFPFLLLLFFSCRFYSDKEKNFSLRLVTCILKLAIPYIAISIIYLLLRMGPLKFAHSELFVIKSFWLKLQTTFLVIYEYLKLLVLPFNLHMERETNFAFSFFNYKVISGLLLLIAMIILIIKCWRKHRIVSFGILWFLIAFVPISNLFITLNAVMAEHWLYIPSIGLSIAVAYGLTELLTYIRSKNLRFLFIGFYFLIFGCILFYGILTVKRNFVWKKGFTFYNDVLKYNKHTARVYNNLGNIYKERKNYKEAIACYEKAFKIRPDSPKAYANLGSIYNDLGLYDKAEREYKKSIAVKDNYTYGYYNLGVVYAKQGKIKEAIKMYEKALELNPYLAEVHNNLAIILKNINKKEDAISHCITALKYNPDFYEAYNTLGNIYKEQAKYEQALTEYKNALKIKPDSAKVYYNIGVVYYYQNKNNKAYKKWKKALQLNPGFKQALDAIQKLSAKHQRGKG